MARMLDHFGPSLKSPWTRLEAPELDNCGSATAMVEGCDEAAGGRTPRNSSQSGTRESSTCCGRQDVCRGRRPGEAGASGPNPEGDDQSEHRADSGPRAAVRAEWIDYNGHMNEAYYVSRVRRRPPTS